MSRKKVIIYQTGLRAILRLSVYSLGTFQRPGASGLVPHQDLIQKVLVSSWLRIPQPPMDQLRTQAPSANHRTTPGTFQQLYTSTQLDQLQTTYGISRPPSAPTNSGPSIIGATLDHQPLLDQRQTNHHLGLPTTMAQLQTIRHFGQYLDQFQTTYGILPNIWLWATPTNQWTTNHNGPTLDH